VGASHAQVQRRPVAKRAAWASSGTELAVLEILDSFGQRSLLTFANLQTNVALARMPSSSSRPRVPT
jgi:hypothetical protein